MLTSLCWCYCSGDLFNTPRTPHFWETSRFPKMGAHPLGYTLQKLCDTPKNVHIPSINYTLQNCKFSKIWAHLQKLRYTPTKTVHTPLKITPSKIVNPPKIWAYFQKFGYTPSKNFLSFKHTLVGGLESSYLFPQYPPLPPPWWWDLWPSYFDILPQILYSSQILKSIINTCTRVSCWSHARLVYNYVSFVYNPDINTNHQYSYFTMRMLSTIPLYR